MHTACTLTSKAAVSSLYPVWVVYGRDTTGWKSRQRRSLMTWRDKVLTLVSSRKAETHVASLTGCWEKERVVYLFFFLKKTQSIFANVMVTKIFNLRNALGNLKIYLNNGFNSSRSTEMFFFFVSSRMDAFDAYLRNKWKRPWAKPHLGTDWNNVGAVIISSHIRR